MKRMILLLLTLCLLCGCKQEKGKGEPVACASKEDCFLCGRAEEEPWGLDNIGLISLNTFEMMGIEINRYDGVGKQIKRSFGTVRMRSFQSGEEGFQASGIEDPDRGYAILTITLGEDGAVDRERAAAFLCGDCLERILPEGEELMGLGAVDLAAGEVRALANGTWGFGWGDFYFHCDWEKGGEKLDLLVFYSPSRCEETV